MSRPPTESRTHVSTHKFHALPPASHASARPSSTRTPRPTHRRLLDGDSSRVERDALADEHDRRRVVRCTLVVPKPATSAKTSLRDAEPRGGRRLTARGTWQVPGSPLRPRGRCAISAAREQSLARHGQGGDSPCPSPRPTLLTHTRQRRPREKNERRTSIANDDLGVGETRRLRLDALREHLPVRP